MAKLFRREDYQRTIPDMTPAPSGVWYVITCKSGDEFLAAEKLEAFYWKDVASRHHKFCRAYVPVKSELCPAARGRVQVRESALFPGYVFICSPVKGMLRFGALRGGSKYPDLVERLRFLRMQADSEPLFIPAPIIESLQRRQEVGDFDSATPTPPKRTLADYGLSEGQQMRITKGAFDGWSAKIAGLTKGGSTARLLVEAIGGKIQVFAPVCDIEKVA